MRRAALLALLVLPGVVSAGDFEFEAMAQRIESACHVKRTHIPLIGIARVAALPFGAHGTRLAVFDDLDSAASARMADVAPPGPEWQLIISSIGRSGDTTKIYARPDGKKIKMLILSVDPGDATLIATTVNPRRFAVRIADSVNGRR